MSIPMQLEFSFKFASSVPQMAKQEAEACGPFGWGWVEASVWTERMSAALVNGVKGGKWYILIDKVCDPRTLNAAWKKVASNKGAARVDKISTKRFRSNAQFYLEELEMDLRNGVFRPSPVKRVHIPKDRKKTRPLGMPTVKDRIVQTALKMVLEPVFEKEFLKTSYGFRPGRGCFDTISHNLLMDRIREKVSDGKTLNLIERFLLYQNGYKMIRYADLSKSCLYDIKSG